MKVKFTCEWTLRIGRLRVQWDEPNMPWQSHDFGGRVRLWAYGPLVITWLKKVEKRYR